MKHVKKGVREELEFDKILDLLISKTQSPKNKHYFQNVRPFSNYNQLKTAYKKLEEFSFAQEDQTFPTFQYQNLQNAIKLLKIENSILEVEDFFGILHAIDFSNKVFKYLKNNPTHWPNIRQIFSTIAIEKELVRKILAVFTAQREIKDNASPKLQEIRLKINTCLRVSGQYFNQALNRYGSSGYLADTKETILNEKRVLAVLAEHRKKVNGRRLGESKTGSVVYIEPKECAHVNEELIKNQEEAKEEIRRILLELTNQFREKRDWLVCLTKIQEELDQLEAKRQLGRMYKGIIPKYSNDKTMEWKDAYHPLLLMKYKETNTKVHPQSFGLDTFQHMIVISGPNAGGKSISLKTVGLLQLMFQCALLVPVDDESVFCLVEEIFTDIGDNQSIENELSTYSHRLKKMREILEHSNQRSLILIDEFGSGSDPVLGGALAAVFFEELYKIGCFSVLTTHYGNIKLMAEEMSGVQNASMLFDEKKLKPLYKLHIGRPGSSFTFEVAGNMGISQDLIAQAKDKVSLENIRYEELINQYQRLNTALEKEKHNLRKKTQRTHTLKKEFDKKLEYIEGREKRLIDQTEEYQRQVSLGKKMEKVILQYKKGKKTKEVFAQFKRLVEVESKVPVEVKKVKRPPVFKERKGKEEIIFKVGDHVKLVGGFDVGEIVELKKDKATVVFGIMKTQIALNRLEFPKKKD
ncbi:MAG: endonuclease MutS2 [Flavobacteriales bacterium]